MVFKYFWPVRVRIGSTCRGSFGGHPQIERTPPKLKIKISILGVHPQMNPYSTYISIVVNNNQNNVDNVW